MAGARHSITSSGSGQPQAPSSPNGRSSFLLLPKTGHFRERECAALAAREIAALQKASAALVEVNLFTGLEERVKRIEDLLRDAGTDVFSGPAERLLLSHDRAWCRREGMFSADVVLVPSRTATGAKRS